MEIKKFEKQKVEVGLKQLLPTREIIDQEETKGVEHSETALRLGTEVDSLEEARDHMITRLVFSKAKLEDFKFKFPA